MDEVCYFFFFSSRRRHTRCSRDWSSDVCSSDLTASLLGFVVGSFFLSLAYSEVLYTLIALAVGLQKRSEEHTSELQSRLHLVCRLLLEKKKKQSKIQKLCN